MKNALILFVFLAIVVNTSGQPDIRYYLPDTVTYNQSIPTPQSVFSFQPGEWHLSHDKLVEYMLALDKASDRISVETFGNAHEGRPLILLTITSASNHGNIAQIREEHRQLTEPQKSAALNTSVMPVVLYIGCSIHGNEASGSNAAPLIAYHLAAAENSEVEEILKNTVILFDPSFNPDGMQRFSSWVNSRKSKTTATDPNDMEHHEPWPSGRYNHYWFDLNRDWLVAQQPESRARVKKFHEWKPNLLTDHHEMGTNSTFFFQPGVPSRNHPLTPARNYEITKRIGEYHAKALDAIGSLYYTQENFDDFYYGKGSTFPDINGGIGILFEQASVQGHAQESSNGILTFPFAIRNQFTTAMSTLRAAKDLRVQLLDYQRQFYKDAMTEAAKDVVKSIVVASDDKVRLQIFGQMLAQHEIDLYRPSSDPRVNGKNFSRENSFVINLSQRQYRLIKSMFEKRKTFSDSLFYDISAWTLPLATGVEFEELKTNIASTERFNPQSPLRGNLIGGRSEYAYAFDPKSYYTPRAMKRLLQQGIKIKVSTATFSHANGKHFERGSIIIPLTGQEKAPALIDYTLNEIMLNDGIDIYAFKTGLDYSGVSLGSETFQPVRKPEIAILVEGNVSPGDAGEIWHLLDVTHGLPATLIPLQTFNTSSIARYNTIIFPSGTYAAITDGAKDKLKSWVQNGGVLIGFGTALGWLTTKEFGKFAMVKSASKDSLLSKPYSSIEAFRGAQSTSGAIFEVEADLTHPLLFGYDRKSMPVFKGTNLFLTKSPNAFANPIVYKPGALLAGYISKENYRQLQNSAYAGVSVVGRGRVIGFTESINFRAFWFGTNRMLMNAIYFGNLIHESTGR